MGNFEKVILHTKNTLNIFGKKASKIVDVSKLKLSAAEAENELTKKFEKLGKLIYKIDKGDESKRLLVPECIQEIDSLYIKIESINVQVSAMNNKVKCQKCGFENGDEALFCIKCGASLKNNDNHKEGSFTQNSPTSDASDPTTPTDDKPKKTPTTTKKTDSSKS